MLTQHIASNTPLLQKRKSVLAFCLKQMYLIAGKFGGGKFGKFGESSVIHQTKTIQIRKESIRQTFPPLNFPAMRYVQKHKGDHNIIT